MDQVLGMMLYSYIPTRIRFPSAVGVLFGYEPHPYSVGWVVGGGSLLFIVNIEAIHGHRNNTRYDKDGFA